MGVCSSILENLTLFQIKICIFFRILFSDSVVIGCIQHLKIRGWFLEPFFAIRGIFWSSISDQSIEDGLLRMENTKKAQDNPSENRQQLQKSSTYLKMLYAVTS